MKLCPNTKCNDGIIETPFVPLLTDDIGGIKVTTLVSTGSDCPVCKGSGVVPDGPMIFLRMFWYFAKEHRWHLLGVLLWSVSVIILLIGVVFFGWFR